jgi:membrane-associated phospholipid phosphatase
MILANPSYRPLALSRRVLPRGWKDLALQLTLFALLDMVYETTRMLAVGDRGVALRHAHDIVSAERTLGIFHELSVQHFAARHDLVQSIANWTYFNCQFTISFGFLFWVYLRRNEAYPLVRNVFLAANAIGLACYTLYPAAPPRMLGGLGFVDTLNETSVNHNSGLIASLSNPYAAMPSLHSADALIVGIVLFSVCRNRLFKAAWLLWPAWVWFAVMGTGNHFWLDVVGGVVVAAIALVIVYRPGWFRIRRRRAGPATA